jgi:hypothetical protein
MYTTVVYTVNSSTGKLAALEMCGFFRYGRPSVPSEALPRDVWLGRISMCVMAVVGTLPLLQDPKVRLTELYSVCKVATVVCVCADAAVSSVSTNCSSDSAIAIL